jgi:imidazolonepropionase-like amidohydrolase
MKKLLLTFCILHTAYCQLSSAQETFPVNGTRENNKLYYAFTNATIFTDYQTKIENATLLIKEGKVEAAGTDIKIPEGAVVTDLKGKFIYPSLVDVYTSYGMPEVKKENVHGPQMESKTKGAYAWNQALKPEFNASSAFAVDTKKAEELRKNGFGSVLTLQQDGIARGTSAFVLLSDVKENKLLLKEKVTACYSFKKGNSTQDYPSSLMGSIALLRQTYFDAQWYASLSFGEGRGEANLSLQAWNDIQSLPQIFETDDFLSALRADKVGDEFNKQYIIKGSGTEYRRMDEIKATNASFILPLNFPDPYDVEDPYDALIVNLDDLKHWEMAPTNLAAFEKNNIPFAITADGLKDLSKFWKNLRKAVENGLSETEALKAITYSPAKLIGVENMVGSLKSGLKANFIITSANLFDKKNIILENWVDGIAYKVNPLEVQDIRGTYDLTIGGSVTYKVKIESEERKPSLKVFYSDTVSTSGDISVDKKMVSLSFPVEKGKTDLIRMSGVIDDKLLSGRCQLPAGTWADWKAVYKEAFVEKAKKDSTDTKSKEIGKLVYPFMAYGWSKQPKQETVIIKNATIWTNESSGKMENTDVLIENGKISVIGKNISGTENVKVIDGTGKHLTAGIIDEHSHIAISKGVNEGAQASSSEVRIGDVVNSEDINIYRQLAGGVVASQLLHGSANPIGGQSALIKLRWGLAPEKMKIENADGFIKFALGENVKQSNWGDNNTVRFPQTRMGVEQVYYDAFIRAKNYEKTWNDFNAVVAKQKGSSGAPRRDIELDALVEILNKKRFITCHSYVQSEINMLMHVADSMGFKVNTFTHILEGYKVADKMKEHGVGASTFSDWWAYKYEVAEAIPYNATILTEQGVVTAINSDDAEMGRRLNQEAAKAVKYGGMSEEDALKMVTLNPAKLLHLDNRMGSIKEGKDADVVLWSDHPLSVYARAEKTFVDGICYYDADKDLLLRDEVRKERARLIQKMIAAKKGGEKTQKPEKKEEKLYHCDTMEEEN